MNLDVFKNEVTKAGMVDHTKAQKYQYLAFLCVKNPFPQILTILFQFLSVDNMF